MHASDKEPIESSGSGTIVAAVGMKGSYTGDTLCDKGSPILLEKMEFPDPVVELSVEPKTKFDLDKLSTALGKMILEDPSLKVQTDEDTGQTILKGMGELHLEIVVSRLATNHGVTVNTGKPKVSYRETITKNGHSDYTLKHQTGGHGQFAHVVINISPAPRGSGLVFASEIVGGIIPKEYIPAVEKGIKGAMERGVISGNPMVDVNVALVDGSIHIVDSSAFAFETAASLAFQEAAKNAGPVVLEPIMSVSVTAPSDFMGAVIGVISTRSGQVSATHDQGNAKVIEAKMPLRRLFGFTNDLRGQTQGRAVPSVCFSHYDVCQLKLSDLDR